MACKSPTFFLVAA